jgi:hypothetical protein
MERTQALFFWGKSCVFGLVKTAIQRRLLRKVRALGASVLV